MHRRERRVWIRIECVGRLAVSVMVRSMRAPIADALQRAPSYQARTDVDGAEPQSMGFGGTPLTLGTTGAWISIDTFVQRTGLCGSALMKARGLQLIKSDARDSDLSWQIIVGFT
jgi:hypothetical protein